MGHELPGEGPPGTVLHSPRQPPKGVAWAPSACGAGARRGRAGAASPQWPSWSWPGCSGRPPSSPTSHSAPVLVSRLPATANPAPLGAPPHLTPISVLAGEGMVLCGDEEGNVWIYDVRPLVAQRPPPPATPQAPTQVGMRTVVPARAGAARGPVSGSRSPAPSLSPPDP